MKFSIIIPVFNCEKLIELCIQHLLEQTFEDFEIILIDDGSTDNSLNVCEKMKKKDSRIKVLNQSNLGAGPARNYGLATAKGDYILFCDVDDYYMKGALEKLDTVTREKSPDLVVGSYCEFYIKGDKTRIRTEKKLKADYMDDSKEIRSSYTSLHQHGMITAPWSKVYKKSIIVSHQIKFPNLRRCQDVVFNLNYFSYINSLSIIDDVIYAYNTPGGNKGVKKYPTDMYEVQKIVYQQTKQHLSSWNVWDIPAEDYFNSIFIHNAMTLFRLNLKNNWRFNKNEKKEFNTKILKDDVLNQIINKPVKNRMNELMRLIIKSKNMILINNFNRCVCIYQSLKQLR